jgi:SAM-dependent methyltransferase
MPHDQFLDPPVPNAIAQWRHYARVLAPGPGQRVLDVGCGSGDPAALLLRLSPECAGVVGRGPSAERLGRARRHIGPRLGFVRGDGRRLPFPDDSFDRVLSADALEWMRPPLDAVCELRRVLRAGGRAVLLRGQPRDLRVRVTQAGGAAGRRVVRIWRSPDVAGMTARYGGERRHDCRWAAIWWAEVADGLSDRADAPGGRRRGRRPARGGGCLRATGGGR